VLVRTLAQQRSPGQWLRRPTRMARPAQDQLAGPPCRQTEFEPRLDRAESWRHLRKGWPCGAQSEISGWLWKTLIVVAIIVGLRALLFGLGVPGLAPTALVSSIIGGGIFVMGLVIAGTLSDYKDAERAPTDLAAGLYAILRETESMHLVWGKPDLSRLRRRLIEVVDALRRDIDAGNTRDCQTAIEDLSDSFIELEESDVPANYVVRLRQEQAGLRKAALRITTFSARSSFLRLMP
jgi:hypothetical protein